jgi:hypothetical protein
LAHAEGTEGAVGRGPEVVDLDFVRVGLRRRAVDAGDEASALGRRDAEARDLVLGGVGGSEEPGRRRRLEDVVFFVGDVDVVEALGGGAEGVAVANAAGAVRAGRRLEAAAALGEGRPGGVLRLGRRLRIANERLGPAVDVEPSASASGVARLDRELARGGIPAGGILSDYGARRRRARRRRLRDRDDRG